MGELDGKVALVTGASRGIGEAAARQFAAEGVAVVLAARSADDIGRIAGEIGAAGGRAVAVTCDVSRHEDVKSAVDRAVAEFGGLDILVNNAAVIEPIGRLADTDPAAWAHAIDVNVGGVYHGMHAAIPAMQARGGGVVVNISSGAANMALEGWSQYCAAKSAVQALTRVAQHEYGAEGIRVVGLSPGTVATEMQVTIKASGINPVSKLDPSAHIPAEWAGQAIVWLCTAAAADCAGEDFRLREEANMRRVGLA
jgi:NAD(P)-dependent dehydrogenase (short-subunit alcohol dehydrogenase family)